MYQPNDIGPTGDSVRVLGRELNTTIRWTSIINLTFISEQVFGNGYDTECIFQVRHEISYRKILSYFPCLNIFPRATIRGRSRFFFQKGGGEGALLQEFAGVWVGVGVAVGGCNKCPSLLREGSMERFTLYRGMVFWTQDISIFLNPN